MLTDADVEDHYNPSMRLIEIEKNNTQCGFQLSRGKWDPYPWVSSVDKESAASFAGLKSGDCVLEVNGEDVIGKRISEIAEIVKLKSEQVSLLLWNAGVDPHCTPEALCCGPLPQNLQRLSACLSTILAFLECPICLDTIPPPTYQCDNGHLICMRCRTKTERCPVCRLRLHRGRSLISDQVYNAVVDAFNLKEESEEVRASRIQQIFKNRNKKATIPDIKVIQSYTNKILAKLTGKSSSVENISSNAKLSSNNSADNDFVDGQLKTKSLSTNEIFISESPVVSRSGSISRLIRKDLNLLQVNHDNKRPASYHGSFESLERNIHLTVTSIHNSFNSLETDAAEKDSILCFCPFSNDCTSLMKGKDVFDHFRNIHGDSGPLIQYFTSKITIFLRELDTQEDISYVVFSNENIFFLKVSQDTAGESHKTIPNILLWVWYLGDKNASKYYEIQAEVKNDSKEDVLLSVRSSVFSLCSTSSEEIKDSKKGIFLSSKSIEALGYIENLRRSGKIVGNHNFYNRRRCK
ncbi:hypothetical protein JTB14_013492 [Gonioctena quinquepunctata]|nr:hypothetical protein JTB14_013492 [Gonioctena quinquepunctata]